MSKRGLLPNAKTNLSKLLDRMLSGEEMIIAKVGQPIARLTPVESRLTRTPGIAKGRVTDVFLSP